MSKTQNSLAKKLEREVQRRKQAEARHKDVRDILTVIVAKNGGRIDLTVGDLDLIDKWRLLPTRLTLDEEDPKSTPFALKAIRVRRRNNR
jgi:hypothetical protein